jgi:hypothetical protein
LGLLERRKKVAMKMDSTIVDGETDSYYKARIDAFIANKATAKPKDSDSLGGAGLGSTLNDRNDSQTPPARRRPSAIAAQVHTANAKK